MSPVDAAIHIDHCAHKTSRPQYINKSLPVLLVLTCCYNHFVAITMFETISPWKCLPERKKELKEDERDLQEDIY